jgi:hypothetical protein
MKQIDNSQNQVKLENPNKDQEFSKNIDVDLSFQFQILELLHHLIKEIQSEGKEMLQTQMGKHSVSHQQ